MKRSRSNTPAIFRKWSIPVWLMLCLIVLAPSAVADASESNTESSLAACRAEIDLPVPAYGDTLDLPHRLISYRELIVRSGELIFRRGIDYRLEAVAGRLIWLRETSTQSGLLTVSYFWLPLATTGSWQGRLTRADADTLLVRPREMVTKRSLPQGANLSVGGSKTFSLEFGNRREVNLSQSLDLSIKGNLAQNVTVKAILTDRNLPLQPEGTTSELADLDQVLIEVKSPWGELHLGDLVVRETEYQFMAHQRELEGVQLMTSVDYRAAATAAVGQGVGKHHSAEFLGQRGKQGPYKLVSQLPGEEKLMVAGSERIWLDNRRLSRGEDSDYTVDYSRAEIWFTSRHPISDVSEIRVDFQVRDGAYQRNYTLVGSALADSSAKVGVTWFREQDDTDHSPTINLDDDERAALAEAGDSITTALNGGITFLGPGLGPYEMVEVDTVETPIFVYLGKDLDGETFLGSYEVTFSSVGDKEGDYVDSLLTSGETIYIFAGNKLGDYLPGRRLQLPESLDLIGVRAGGDLGYGLTMLTEGAFSWLDRNVLSKKDDEDNSGAALSVKGNWHSGKRIGSQRDLLELRFQYRDVNDRFASPEPLDGTFYFRRWNIAAPEAGLGSRRGTAGLTLRPLKSIKIDGDWESLQLGDKFSGERVHARAERIGRLSSFVEGWVGRSRADGVPGREERGRAQIGWRQGIDLKTEYLFEDLRRGEKGEESGSAYRTVDFTVGSGELIDGVMAVASARLRRNYVRSTGVRKRDSGQRRYQTEIDISRDHALAHLTYATSVSLDEQGKTVSRTNLADWDISYKLPKQVFRGEWRGKLTMEESALRSERVIYIGSEAGHYDSLGHYVGIGDYELYYSHADSSDLETRLESIGRLGGKPFWSLAAPNSILRGIDASVYGKVTVSTPKDAQSLLTDRAQIWRGIAPVRRHTGLLRWEISWKGRRGLPVPRLSIDQRRSTQRSYTGFARLRKSLRQNLDTRWVLRQGVQGRLELEQTQEEQGIAQSSASASTVVDDLLKRRVALEWRWRFFGPLAARLGGETGINRLNPAGTQDEYYQALLGASADFSKRGRLELVWERRWSDGSTGGSGAFVLDRPGWKLTATGSLRPKPGLTTSINLRIEKREGQEQVVTGRMDAKAFF